MTWGRHWRDRHRAQFASAGCERRGVQPVESGHVASKPCGPLVPQNAPCYIPLENDFQLHGTLPKNATAHHENSLCDLPVGATARVRAVDWRPALTVRLLEMGLVPGTPVSLVKRAVLGGPLELSVRGYHLSLRRDEARLVRVDTVG